MSCPVPSWPSLNHINLLSLLCSINGNRKKAHYVKVFPCDFFVFYWKWVFNLKTKDLTWCWQFPPALSHLAEVSHSCALSLTRRIWRDTKPDNQWLCLKRKIGNVAVFCVERRQMFRFVAEWWRKGSALMYWSARF